jgi:hypothetical protein
MGRAAEGELLHEMIFGDFWSVGDLWTGRDKPSFRFSSCNDL